MKVAIFLGDSQKVVRSFPEAVRSEAGFQLEKVQRGEEPDDWKPMRTIGSGVREIRIRDAAGAFRIVYTTTIGEFVYVLHAFQKKTEATSQRDIELARIRHRMLTGRN
ncbi:MAG TPA: type II toxin-antitoxin system RelE/ParE family toxin [Rhizomicrobium sp.]|jgi:phage-related protein|nr:type II toxin-antitoxin system RelE/ParE family toxin [Rhizomicrobium sp.]